MAKCKRCKGDGHVYLMPDGHQVECPACEGTGDDDEMTERDTGDEFGQILSDALSTLKTSNRT